MLSIRNVSCVVGRLTEHLPCSSPLFRLGDHATDLPYFRNVYLVYI